MSHSHSHDHHSHSHGHSHDDIHSANKQFFDKISTTYSHQSSHRAVIETITKAILSEPSLIPLNESSTRLLDYACGPGLVSKALLAHVASIVGMDLSPGMVDEYNTAASNQGLGRSEMHAVVADLCSPDSSPSLEEYAGFDVAVCSFAFHHIPDPALAARKIAERLKSGGVFALVDFRTHGEIPGGEAFRHIVAHNGFGEGEVARWFEEAGLGEVKWVDVGDGGKGVSVVVTNPDTGEEVVSVKKEAFIAVGRRG